MLPVTSNTTPLPSEGCSPISTSCVVWNGPDIPCINLCAGDSIEKVVYNLATVLCEITEGVLDVTTLDFKCLVTSGQSEPTTLLATIQKIIDKVCETPTSGGTGGTVVTPTPIPLPTCLYYTEGGDTITQLLPNAYSAYLAARICTILSTITTIQSTLTSLNLRVTTLENTIGGLGSGLGEITIQTQCASGVTPGLTLTVQQAFTNFESKFCQLQDLLGNNTALNTAIAKECPGLDSANQLNNPSAIMSALSGWVSTPGNISQTIVNMWLTICDMRSKLITLAGAPSADCAVLPPYNVQITSLTVTGCTVKWNAPPTGAYLLPTGYTITVTEWNGTTTVGSPIATVTKTYPSIEHTFTSIGDTTKTYIVQVAAQYTCGESEKGYAIGRVRISPILYYIKVEDETKVSSVSIPCLTGSVPAVERMTTITLIDPVTGASVVNTGAPLTAVLRYNTTGTCITPVEENITLSIASGQSSGTYTYLSEKAVLCEGVCVIAYKSYTCAVSVGSTNIAFAPSVTIC